MKAPRLCANPECQNADDGGRADISAMKATANYCGDSCRSQGRHLRDAGAANAPERRLPAKAMVRTAPSRAKRGPRPGVSAYFPLGAAEAVLAALDGVALNGNGPQVRLAQDALRQAVERHRHRSRSSPATEPPCQESFPDVEWNENEVGAATVVAAPRRGTETPKGALDAGSA